MKFTQSDFHGWHAKVAFFTEGHNMLCLRLTNGRIRPTKECFLLCFFAESLPAQTSWFVDKLIVERRDDRVIVEDPANGIRVVSFRVELLPEFDHAKFLEHGSRGTFSDSIDALDRDSDLSAPHER
jgi:hypothetical protein